MRHSQHLRLGQRLALTHGMRKSLELLAMNEVELGRLLAEEAERNPCLWLRGAVPTVDEPDDIEALPASAPSLEAHLAPQIDLIFSDDVERSMAWILTATLDPTGWLTVPLEQIAAQNRIDFMHLRSVLARLQSGIEPSGLYGRNLREVLQIQLRDQGDLTSPMQMLLDNLEFVRRGDVAGLSRLCKCSTEIIAEMLRTLRCLDPKPGLGFEAMSEPIQTPDLIARRSKSGWQVALVRGRQSDIEIRVPKISNGDLVARAFLEEARQTALRLKRAIVRRRVTTLRAATAVVAWQSDYLDDPSKDLRPLALSDLSELLGLHVSTVSRALSNRLIDTPHGTILVKDLFSRDAGSASIAGVCRAVGQIVAGEEPGRPLSDSEIRRRLAGLGHRVSRRSVADYRKSCGIPNASERRRQSTLSNCV